MIPGGTYAPGQELPGTVYRVVRHLATGGMGSVYEVEDTSVGKRYVLKTLHPQLVAREDLAQRMRDEARSLARLQHPHIVDVFTAGVTKDTLALPYFVMERLVGQNLRSVLEKRGALEPVHAFRIALDVAEALYHAHEHAIVHRDVKPENIFLHRNATGETITKLLDFGIVRLLDRSASLTQGKFVGTLRYASPEQITGRPIGTASDLYSLGTVIYEMLAGRGPFDDAGDMYAVGAAHASVAPPPLGRFARVAPEVERLVAWTLAKDPAQRPRDAFTLAGELRRLLETEEVESSRAATVAVVLSQTPPVAAALPAEGAPTSRSPGPGSSAAETPVRAEALTESAAPTAPEPSPGNTPPTRNERAGHALAVAATVAAAAPASNATREAPFAPEGVELPKVVVRVSAPPPEIAPTAVSPAGTPVPAPPAPSRARVLPTEPMAPSLPPASGPAPAVAWAASARPAAPRAIDRDAPTRETPAGLGQTQRVPQNDTQLEPPVRPAAPAARPSPAPEPAPPPEALAARRTASVAERAPGMLLGGAMLFAVLVVGAALAFVRLRAPADRRAAAPPAESVLPAVAPPGSVAPMSSRAAP